MIEERKILQNNVLSTSHWLGKFWIDFEGMETIVFMGEKGVERAKVGDTIIKNDKGFFELRKWEK